VTLPGKAALVTGGGTCLGRAVTLVDGVLPALRPPALRPPALRPPALRPKDS
jgi:hypothetical protein